MLGRNMHMSSANSPLQERPMAFNRIGVRIAINPNVLRVIDRAVLVPEASKFTISPVLVSADGSAALHVAANHRLNRLFQTVRYRPRDHSPVTLQHADNDALVFQLPRPTASGVLAADKGLVDFDVARQWPIAIRLRHELAKLVSH